MSAVTDATTQVARKPHRCTWCWQLIGAGEPYTRYRYYGGDSDAGTVKAHPECYEAIQDAARKEGGMVEWTPGQERPAKLVGQAADTKGGA